MRNPKSEILDPKQIRMFKIQNLFGSFEFEISNLFGISCLEFRIFSNLCVLCGEKLFLQGVIS